jgi:hypothetical protein
MIMGPRADDLFWVLIDNDHPAPSLTLAKVSVFVYLYQTQERAGITWIRVNVLHKFLLP